MGVWLIANASLAADVVTVGLVLATMGAALLSGFSGVYGDIRLNPATTIAYFRYFGVFAVELVKANLNVARIVFSPKIDIQPGIVEIKTRLKTYAGRWALANSITLTPGTLTVDIQGDSLFIHWINVTDKDPEAATREIAGKFEKYLEVIYG